MHPDLRSRGHENTTSHRFSFDCWNGQLVIFMIYTWESFDSSQELLIILYKYFQQIETSTLSSNLGKERHLKKPNLPFPTLHHAKYGYIDPAVQEKISINVKKKVYIDDANNDKQRAHFDQKMLFWVFASGQLKHKWKVVNIYVLNAQ